MIKRLINRFWEKVGDDDSTAGKAFNVVFAVVFILALIYLLNYQGGGGSPDCYSGFKAPC